MPASSRAKKGKAKGSSAALAEPKKKSGAATRKGKKGAAAKGKGKADGKKKGKRPRAKTELRPARIARPPSLSPEPNDSRSGFMSPTTPLTPSMRDRLQRFREDVATKVRALTEENDKLKSRNEELQSALQKNEEEAKEKDDLIVKLKAKLVANGQSDDESLFSSGSVSVHSKKQSVLFEPASEYERAELPYDDQKSAAIEEEAVEDAAVVDDSAVVDKKASDVLVVVKQHSPKPVTVVVEREEEDVLAEDVVAAEKEEEDDDDVKAEVVGEVHAHARVEEAGRREVAEASDEKESRFLSRDDSSLLSEPRYLPVGSDRISKHSKHRSMSLRTKMRPEKMKALHWRKLSEDCDWSATVWSGGAPEWEMVISPAFEDSLVTAFAVLGSATRQHKSGRLGLALKQRPSLYGESRIEEVSGGFAECGILESVSAEQLRDALLSMDVTTLQPVLGKPELMPTNYELTLVRRYDGDLKQLSAVESAFFTLSCMNNIPLRLELCNEMQRFSKMEEDMLENMATVRNALMRLKNSKQLVKFLDVCLTIGNYINEGTDRGAAKGIQIGASMKQFRALCGSGEYWKIPLLCFAVGCCRTSMVFTHVFDAFPSELKQVVKEALAIDHRRIRESLADLRDLLADVSKKMRFFSTHELMETEKEQLTTAPMSVTSTPLQSLDESEATTAASEPFPAVVPASKLSKKRASTSGNDVGALSSLKSFWEKQVEESQPEVIDYDKVRRSTTTEPPKLDQFASDDTDDAWLNDDATDTDDEVVLGTGDAETNECKEESKCEAVASDTTKDFIEDVVTGFYKRSLALVEGMERDFSKLRIYAGEVAVYFGERDDVEWAHLLQMFADVFEMFESAELIWEVKKKKDAMKRKMRGAKPVVAAVSAAPTLSEALGLSSLSEEVADAANAEAKAKKPKGKAKKGKGKGKVKAAKGKAAAKKGDAKGSSKAAGSKKSKRAGATPKKKGGKKSASKKGGR